MIKDSPTVQVIQNVKYYAAFQLVFVIFSIVLSSIGAFFHFLLDHEISIVEAWLHNNQWEILILSKILSLFLLNQWFKVQHYELKTIRKLFRELVTWPDPKVVVIAVFMVMSYMAIGKMVYVEQNIGYWYFQIASFFGLFIFFGIEFIVIAYLEDVLNHKSHPPRLPLGICYILIFSAAFTTSVPDYYKLMPYMILCYSSLLILSGKSFKNWSNAVCFLILFIAPMGSLLGLDPVWGDDFSPFRINEKLNLAFLAVIWVISFSYYKFREQLISSARKLFR